MSKLRRDPDYLAWEVRSRDELKVQSWKKALSGRWKRALLTMAG